MDVNEFKIIKIFLGQFNLKKEEISDLVQSFFLLKKSVFSATGLVYKKKAVQQTLSLFRFFNFIQIFVM